MKHPTKKQMQKVIDLLYSILPLTFESGEGHLDMQESKVSHAHECGTVHCFAGWVAVAALEAGLLKGRVEFHKGKRIVSNILNLSGGLGYWAADNPSLWGNKYGGCVYNYANAFYHPTRRPKGAQSISDIINHMEEVRDRLPK